MSAKTFSYWKDIGNRRKFLDELSKALNLQDASDWKKITAQHLVNHDGAGFLRLYKGSVLGALQDIYPERDWSSLYVEPELRFHPGARRAPRDHWSDINNQRKYFESLEPLLNIRQRSDWKHVRTKQLLQFSGARTIIKTRYDGSLQKVLEKIFPEESWEESATRSRHYWRDINNQRALAKNIEAKLNLTSIDQWNEVRLQQVADAGGAPLLLIYGNNLARALRAIYPDHHWKPTERHRVPKNYWLSVDNQRQVFDEAAVKLNIQKMQDWTKFTPAEIQRAHKPVERIIGFHNGSLFRALTAVYPDHPWREQDFSWARKPNGYWLLPANQRAFFDNIMERKGIKSKEDWANVTTKEIEELGGKPLLAHHDYSLYKALQVNYPEYDWSGVRSADWISQLSVPQRRMTAILETFVPDIMANYKSRSLTSPSSERPVELDAFSPSLRLGVEFQGEHHYHNTFAYRDVKSQRQRDADKQVACAQAGITLVLVPYWWNGSKEQLLSTIVKYRPDLTNFFSKLANSALDTPVSDEPPQQNIFRVTSPDGTSKERPAGVLLAEHWTEDLDPTNWWITEKFDGIRAIWNGHDFYSRNRKKIEVPSSYKMHMPNFALDGELWIGLRSFQKCLSVVLGGGNSSEWNHVTFKVFDAPNVVGPYETRMEWLKNAISPENMFIQVVERIRCEGRDHLLQCLDAVVKDGGEGIILRQPNSMYEARRSPTMLKVKPRFADEAAVLNIDEPERTIVKNTFGKTFQMRISQEDVVKNKISSGSIITYKFFGLTKGIFPRYPSFVQSYSPSQFKELTPYFLTLSRHHAKCRGCSRALSTRDLRIQVKAAYYGRSKEGSEPSFIPLYFCPDASCVQKANQIDGQNRRASYPPFENVLGLPADVALEADKSGLFHDQILRLEESGVRIIKRPAVVELDASDPVRSAKLAASAHIKPAELEENTSESVIARKNDDKTTEAAA